MAEKGKIPIPKKQRDISESFVNPYDSKNGDPNKGDFDPKNRANHISFRGDTTKPFSLGLEEHDSVIFYYMENVIKPTIIQNGVSQKVPIVYGSPERWKSIQKDGYYRDKQGQIMMPLITFKRTDITNRRDYMNKVDANFPNNAQLFTKTYTGKNTYDKFNILNNRTQSKDYYAVVIPDYVTLTYDFIISTYYVDQMNKIIEAINYASNAYWGDPERFKFRTIIDGFKPNVDVPQGEHRIVKTTFSLKMDGYIVPNNIQKQLSSLKKFSNKNQIKFSYEVVRDINNLGGDTFEYVGND